MTHLPSESLTVNPSRSTSTTLAPSCISTPIFCSRAWALFPRLAPIGRSTAGPAKKQVFAQLDELSAVDVILANNSSSYASRMFLDKVHRPERVLNIHFYMPPKQNAVDVMSCGKTDRDILDFVMTTMPEFGLYPFEARRESTGFIFNRIWAAVKRECIEVVAEGMSTPQEVDRMFEINTGSAAGPFRMMDQVGVDVVLDIDEHYCAEHPEGPRRLLRSYLQQGRLGVKSGAGFYDDYLRTADHRSTPNV
jgi:3-hydroxybutyryl-CoA dehydrogenase